MPKITGFFHGCFQNGYVILKATKDNDNELLTKIFNSKKQRENRSGSEILLNVTLDAPFQKRSIKENNLAWVLISIIFESMEGRKGTSEELHCLYSDLLEEYAMRRPSRLNPNILKPIDLKEADTVQAAYFIDGLFFHLTQVSDLTLDQQQDAVSQLRLWQQWRGEQPQDFTSIMTEEQWRQRAKYSEVSGLTQNLDLHHIITRGSHPEFANYPENWICLTREEHQEFHDIGEAKFIQKYPHIAGRIQKAHEKLNELTCNHFLNIT